MARQPAVFISHGAPTVALEKNEYAEALGRFGDLSEHFDPLFVVLGSRQGGDGVRTIHEGLHYGSLSMRCFALVS